MLFVPIRFWCLNMFVSGESGEVSDAVHGMPRRSWVCSLSLKVVPFNALAIPGAPKMP